MDQNCRHALKVSGCENCGGLDPSAPVPQKFCGDGFRHAIRETWCPSCLGAEPAPRKEMVSLRDQAIRAASDEERAAIKAWRNHWRTMRAVLCHWCRQIFAPSECHADHVIPLSRGGLHSLGNLVIACALCNLRKSALMPETWAMMAEVRE